MEIIESKYMNLSNNKTLVIGDRGVGKTNLLINLAVDFFLKGGFHIVFIETNHTVLKDIARKIINKLIEKSNDDTIITSNNHNLISSDKVSSTIKFVQTRSCHYLRGSTIDCVLADNIDLYDFHDMMISVYPMLASSHKSRIIATASKDVPELHSFNKIHMERNNG